MNAETHQWYPLTLVNGKPYSSEFGDVYYSGEGQGEVEFVFLEPCDIAGRFAGGEPVTVGELGFGSALNFLCTWKCFRESAASGASLDYFSCERYPLSAADLLSICPADPTLASLAQELCAYYPPQPSGLHALSFDGGRVRLTVAFEDVRAALPFYPLTVTAWFLDGFAPDRNPAMWDDHVIAAIAQHSAPRAKLSTYTAAGDVKRRLRDAGFEVARRKGYGTKRHMLVGTLGTPA